MKKINYMYHQGINYIGVYRLTMYSSLYSMYRKRGALKHSDLISIPLLSSSTEPHAAFTQGHVGGIVLEEVSQLIPAMAN